MRPGRAKDRFSIVALNLVALSLSTAGASEARPWDASMRTFAGYSDNVALISDDLDDETASANGGFVAQASYRFRDDARWTFGSRGSASILGNMDRDAEGFDYLSVGAGVFAGRSLELWQRPARATFGYDFNQDLVDFEAFEARHTLSAALERRGSGGTHVGAFYRLAISDFDRDVGSGDGNRDAVRNTLGLSAQRLFHRGREALSGQYAFSVNQAEGSAFDFLDNQVSLRFRTAVALPLLASVELSYSNQRYIHFPGSPDRKTQIITPRFTLDLPLGRRLGADFFFAYSKYASNRDEFDAEVIRTGFGVDYRF